MDRPDVVHRPRPALSAGNSLRRNRYLWRLDSVFAGGLVLRGTIGTQSLSLQSVPGTDGATRYALAEGGASIVFTRRNSVNLFVVPATGGAATVAATVTAAPSTQLFGVSCRGSMCIVADGPATIWAPVLPGPGSDVTRINPGLSELRSVSIATGSSSMLVSVATADRFGNVLSAAGVFASPLIVPESADVVVQIGRELGHLQTNIPAGTTVNLRLYPGILH